MTGQTVWRKQWERNFGSEISTAGLGSHFYFTGTSPVIYAKKRWEESIYQGEMATGEAREVAKLKTFPDSVWHDPSGFDFIARGRMIEPFVRGVDTLILVSYDLPDMRPYYSNTPTVGCFSLYNLTQKKWVYERMPMLSDVKTGKESEVGVGNYPNIIGDRVYFAVGMWVGCYELMTGNILWKQRSSAISSALHYQDGVVYYMDTKILLATRVSDGKLLWGLPCPDAYTEKRTDSWFMGFVTGLPGKNGQKGRIFASTNLNVYCFEAAQ